MHDVQSSFLPRARRGMLYHLDFLLRLPLSFHCTSYHTYTLHTWVLVHLSIHYSNMICSALITLILLRWVTAWDCPCGWKVKETGEVYTHRIFEDFATLPDNHNLVQNHANNTSAAFPNDWMIYDF